MLSVADELLVLSGETASLKANGFPSEPLTAYNFEIEDFHTYVAGEKGLGFTTRVTHIENDQRFNGNRNSSQKMLYSVRIVKLVTQALA